jgi:hypothetical protein
MRSLREGIDENNRRESLIGGKEVFRFETNPTTVL